MNIEALRTFAFNHGQLEFAHMCTAAMLRCDGEEWAVIRVQDAQALIDGLCGRTDEEILAIIRATDTTRPDGARARGLAL